MSPTPGPRRQLRIPWLTRDQIAEDIDDELAFHLAQTASELREKGMPAEDAAREAARRFGDLDTTRRYCRDQDIRREPDSNANGRFWYCRYWLWSSSVRLIASTVKPM